MNTRSRGSLTSSVSKGEDHIKRNASTNTKNFQEQTAVLGRGPVFNIHIHLPANNDINTSKMYLPRVQPIVHVHFDELANRLRNSASHQEGKLNEKYLQTLVEQITPKFGSIFFHCSNSTFIENSNSCEIDNPKPNPTLRGKTSNIELESSRYCTRQKQNKSADHGPNKRTQEIKSDKLSNVVINKHPIKLKKAVVVLEDIFHQPSFHKSGRTRNSLSEISVSQSSPSSLSNGATNLGPQIKVETASSPACSPTVYENEKSCAGSDNCINSFNSTNSFDSLNFKSSEEELSLKRESLASLVQGCNFSEILKKFREKYKKYADECLKKPNISAEGQTLLGNNNVEQVQNYIQTQKEEFWVDQSFNVDDKQEEEEEDGKYWVNLQDGIKSHETENQPRNSNEKNIGTSECNNSEDFSVEESRNVVDQMHCDLGVESLINPFHIAEIESDDNEITTRNKLSSDVVEDLKQVEFDSCNPASNIVIKSEFSLVETNESVCTYAGDQYFNLTLVNEEMVSPKRSTDKMANNENRNSKDGENGSSTKKFEQLSGTAKKLTTKAPKSVDYIPLNISGPTEFAVAPLSNVQGCKAHAAQNFKKDMLFGKRITRFTNPEYLRMYKMKKQQKYCENNKTLKK